MNVLEYTNETLAKLLCNSYTDIATIYLKNHYRYLCDYLGNEGLCAKTVVEESDYISRDYLHDYVAYYGLCFRQYENRCRRIHFFSSEFSADEFVRNVTSTRDSVFWNSYLGFVVVRPTPKTVIGFTLLKTYSDKPEKGRNYWGIRPYSVHVYGNEVHFNSLAFQEQDSVISACATTAIWSMLNKAATDAHTTLKSPSQITADADNMGWDGSRLFPNKGLSILQICQAVLNSGLVCEVKKPDTSVYATGKGDIPAVSALYLKKIVRAYAPIGIPLLLAVKVPTTSGYGMHAMVVTGHHEAQRNSSLSTEGPNWKADNMDKIYVHDDQWGPFVRILINDDNTLDTYWNQSGKPTVLTNIIIPIRPKIRISFEDIEKVTFGLHGIMEFLFQGIIKAEISWDILVDYSEHIKQKIKNSKSLDEKTKLGFLKQSMPKYIWVSSCYIGEHNILDFIFDATDMNTGMIGIDVVCYLENDIKQGICQHLVENRNILQPLLATNGNRYYNMLIEKLTESN